MKIPHSKVIRSDGAILTTYANEEKGTVVVKLENCERFTDMMLRRLTGGFGLIHFGLSIDDFFIGKAKLHPDDEWDLEQGARIAKHRVFNRYNKRRNELLNSVAKHYEALATKLQSNLIPITPVGGGE